MSSTAVVNYRLKHGQCIHCGNQTHKVVKKMFKSERIPLTITGIVENGRCLGQACLKAGNSVVADAKPPTRNSGPGIASAAGAAASFTGSVMTGCGIPGGGLLSTIGGAVSSATQTQPTALSSYNNVFEQQMQQLMQQNQANYEQQMQQIMQQQAAYEQQMQQIMQRQT